MPTRTFILALYIFVLALVLTVFSQPIPTTANWNSDRMAQSA